MRCLLLEDNPLTREGTASALGLSGWYCVTAESGESGVVRASRVRPADVVLVDHFLPGIDGLEALSRIRDLPGWDRVPAVLITAADARTAAIEARLREMQPARLVNKPCEFQALEAILREMAKKGGAA